MTEIAAPIIKRPFPTLPVSGSVSNLLPVGPMVDVKFVFAKMISVGIIVIVGVRHA